MTNNFTPAKAGGQRPRLSKEEYAEKMKAEKEAVYQMADDAAKAIVSDPEKFKAFLDTQSRLDRYSAVNALLIFKQLPEASQLKNFDDWSKDNIKITKGAKSISILEPVEYAKRDGTTGISYNVKKVFDVSQTNSANFLFTLWKRVRKYGAYATGITQNVDDLLQSHTARTMLANSEFLIMLNQASTDRLELAKLLNISDRQLSYITNVDAGHGLIKVGSSLVPFANKFPKNTKLYKLMTTKPGEGA